MENIKKIHISFSSGETSAWMTYYLLRVYYKCYYCEEDFVHKGVDPVTKQEVNIIVTFANTGQENEESLIFADKCDKHFGFRTVWLEAIPRFKINGKVLRVIDHLDEAVLGGWFGSRLGTKHRVTNFEDADREGKVFESFIARYGIPNTANMSCTRELKLRPMTSYLRGRGWKKGDYYSAIGIRVDEVDRVNKDRKKLKLMYPAISIKPMTKPKINGFWLLQPFRLNLKGYQGNCKWCYKKASPKLWQIARETPDAFDFPRRMEDKYGEYITPDRLRHLEKEGKEIPKEGDRKIRFFRKNKSVRDIFEESFDTSKQVVDDSEIYETESCEVYSNCGEI